MGDPFKGPADLVFFSIGGLLGCFLAWSPRRVASFLFGRRVAAEMPEWVERFDRTAAVVVVIGVAYALIQHFISH